jgi:hypothetical protein
MRMQVSAGRGMLKSNDVPIFEELDIGCFVYVRVVPGFFNAPVVVVVFVVIACYLLLLRPERKSLCVRMEKTTSETHIFEGKFGAVRHLYPASIQSVCKRE